jgi:lauroyl/myristoyl acyltransferase
VSPPLVAERGGDRRADVAALARVVAAELERAIARRPADWHLFEPAWP